MTIEADLAKSSIHLSRIAESLESIDKSLITLLAEQGVVQATPESKLENYDSDGHATPAKKKTAKKKTTKKTTVGKKSSKKKKKDDDDEGPTLVDVRAMLHELKAGVSQAAVKSLLKSYGASTLGQVDEKHYANIIADAEGELE